MKGCSALGLALIQLALGAAAASADPAPPRAAVSVRTFTATQGAPALTADLLVTAIARRLNHARVDVRPWQADQRGVWQVVVLASPAEQVELLVTDPDDRLLLRRVVDARGRRPRDLAHTLALLALEALSPAMPQLGSGLPPGPRAPPARAPPPTLAPPPSAPWRVGVGGLVAASLPAAATFGVQIGVAWRGGGVLGPSAEVDLTWHATRTVDDGDLILSAGGGAALLGVGLWRRWAGFALSFGVGPALRLSHLEAKGEDLAFESGDFLDAGLGARLWAWRDVGPVSLGLGLQGTRYLRYRRLTADGRTALDTGHSALGVSLQVGRVF